MLKFDPAIEPSTFTCGAFTSIAPGTMTAFNHLVNVTGGEYEMFLDPPMRRSLYFS